MDKQVHNFIFGGWGGNIALPPSIKFLVSWTFQDVTPSAAIHSSCRHCLLPPSTPYHHDLARLNPVEPLLDLLHVGAAPRLPLAMRPTTAMAVPREVDAGISCSRSTLPWLPEEDGVTRWPSVIANSIFHIVSASYWPCGACSKPNRVTTDATVASQCTN